MRRTLSTPADRWRSAALATALNLVLGYAIVVGLGVPVGPVAQDALKLFTLSDQPPPPPPIVPPPPEKARQETHKPKDPEGAAAPPAKKNTPSEVVAPKAKLPPPPPPPIRAAPVAGQGTAPKSGAATIDGPGTGRGGIGNGTGSGLSGNGSGGGGGAASEPEQVAGSIGNEDYPRAALVDREQGTTVFAFTITLDGRLANCHVIGSSGNRALDATTCRLATQRYRFRPARDSAGRAVSTEEEGEQHWTLGREIETIDPPQR